MALAGRCVRWVLRACWADCARASEQLGVARRRAVGVDDGGAAGGGVLLQACEQAASGQAHPTGQAGGRLHARRLRPRRARVW
eukprot:scaffold101144_cov63-Phaeocystis_antarctica.AAC.5